MGKFFKDYRAKFVANLPFKVAALVIAFSLWFFVLNMEEPVVSGNASVRFELRHMGGLEQLADPVFLENAAELLQTQILVSVRGTHREISSFEESAVAYVDLSTAAVIHGAGTRSSLRVNIQLEGDFESVAVGLLQPSSVELHFDSIESVDVPVQLEIFGIVDADFILIEEEKDHPQTLSVRGPSRIINSIDRLLIEADMQGRQSSLRLEGYRPRALNFEGNDVDVSNVSFAAVDVFIPVYRRAVAVFVAPAHDAPAAGFGVREVELSQRQFAVFGTDEALAALQPITPEAMELGGASATFSRSFTINNYLPSGVYLIDRQNYRITATVVIEPVASRTFTINREMIAVTGVSTNSQILTEQVNVTITGIESVVEDMTRPDVSISLAGLEYGQHQINLNVNLPARANLVGAPSVLVQIGDDVVYDPSEPYPPYETTEPPDEDEDEYE